MSEKTKDLLSRAFHTFWQGFLASAIVTIPAIIENAQKGWDVVKPMLISAGVGALAAGFSALKTGVIVPYLEKKKAEGTKDGKDDE